MNIGSRRQTLMATLVSLMLVGASLGVSSAGVIFSSQRPTDSRLAKLILGDQLFGCGIANTQSANLAHDANFTPARSRPDWRFVRSTTGEVGSIQKEIGQNGSYAARITVNSESAVGYPAAFEQTLSGVSPANTLTLTAEVKTHDLGGGGLGAYVTIAYRGPNGVTSTFPQTFDMVGAIGWTQVSYTGTVPPGTTQATVELVLNGTGTATFDNVNVIEQGYEPTVTLTPRNQVVNAELDGLGLQTNPFAFDATNHLSSAEIALVEKRLDQLHPAWARIFLNSSWWVKKTGFDFGTPMMNALLKDVAMYQSMHARVNLVLWESPNWNPPYSALEKDLVALLQWLQTKGMGNVRLLTLGNEPDISYYFPSDADYVRFYRAMRSALDQAGLTNIGLVEGDVAYPDDPFVETVAPDLKGTASVLSFHLYPNYTSSLCTPVMQSKKMVQLGDSSGAPNVFMWESNLTGGNGAGTYTPGVVLNGALLPTQYPVALKLSAFYLQVLAAGVKGISYWEAFDFLYPGPPETMMKFGLWSSALHGMKLRPAYFAYELLSRYIQPGASVMALRETPQGSVIADVIRDPKTGVEGIYVINPWSRAMNVTMRLPGQSTGGLRSYVFDENTVEAALKNGQLALPGRKILAPANAQWTQNVPPESMVLLEIHTAAAREIQTSIIR